MMGFIWARRDPRSGLLLMGRCFTHGFPPLGAWKLFQDEMGSYNHLLHSSKQFNELCKLFVQATAPAAVTLPKTTHIYLRILGQDFKQGLMCRGCGSVNSRQGLSPINHHPSPPASVSSLLPWVAAQQLLGAAFLSQSVCSLCGDLRISVPQLLSCNYNFLFWGKKSRGLAV